MDIKEVVTKIKYIDGGAILSLADKVPQLVDVKAAKKKAGSLLNKDNLDKMKSTARLAKDIVGWVPQWFQSMLP